MNPPTELTAADLQRVYDRMDALRDRLNDHEQSDLKVHGDFKAFMLAADEKLDQLIKTAARQADNSTWIVRLIFGALAMAVISFALKGGFNIQ